MAFFPCTLGRRSWLSAILRSIDWVATGRGCDFNASVLYENHVVAARKPQVVDGKRRPVNTYTGRDIP